MELYLNDKKKTKIVQLNNFKIPHAFVKVVRVVKELDNNKKKTKKNALNHRINNNAELTAVENLYANIQV